LREREMKREKVKEKKKLVGDRTGAGVKKLAKGPRVVAIAA
jgi:hypothetical protein